MIDDVGLVNMNGRIYDPEIGRFMSADPFVSDPTNGQDLNRYAYVHNNPLSFTDPTGYFSLGGFLKMLITVVIAVVAIVYGQAWVAGALYGSDTTAAAACTTLCGAIAGAIGGAISAGISSGGDLRSIVVGAVGGAAFGALGASTDVQGLNPGLRVAAYGMTGGVTSVMGGGSFQSGFLAAGFGALAGPEVQKLANGGDVLGVTASAVAGGIGSVLGGGKFENGAISGAFAYAAGRVLVQGGAAKGDAPSGKKMDGSGPARPLTKGEAGIATAEYPDLDVNKVRIAYDQRLPIAPDAAITPDNTVHFPPSMSGCTDFSICYGGRHIGWFVHELGHSWQYQHGIDPAMVTVPHRVVRLEC